MQEFWFCASCKSMNRADAKRCYKCRALKEQATLATVGERKQGVVLTPGLDDDHREVAWLLMSGQRYVSAWRLGYVAAGLMMVALATWTFNTAMLAIFVALELIDPGGQAASTLNGNLIGIGALMSLIGLALPLAVVLDSVFLGLTSMNSPALGSGSPQFGPVRAGLWWIETLLWLVWGVLLLGLPIYLVSLIVIPLELIATGGLLLGAILAILWLLFVRWAYGELGGPFAAIGKPRRVLQDLMDRLGIPESSDSRLVGHWSMAWGTLVGILYAVVIGPLVLLITFILVLLVAGLAGIELTPAPEGQVALYATLLFGLVLTALLIAYGTCLFTRARITLELSRRQRVREAWVRSGTDVPNAGAAAQGLPAASAASVVPQPGYAPLGYAPPGYAPLGYAPPGYAPPGYAAPAWSGAQPAPSPAPVPRPSDDPVVWSRPVERFVPQPDSAPSTPAELPSAWVRAIERSAPPAQGEGQQTPAADGDQPAEPADGRVIQPSSSGLSRYRDPFGEAEPDPPIAGLPGDLDLGGGI